MALTDNLVAAYPLDSVNDFSGNSNSLTNNNSVAFNAGLVGNAADFGTSNTTKYLRIASDLGITNSGSWTISYWAKLLTAGNFCATTQFTYASGVRSFILARDIASGQYSAFTQNGANNGAYVTAVSNNSWHHILATVSSGSSVTVYIDGTSRITVVNPSDMVAQTSELTLGRAAGVYGTSCDGLIDSYYVWSRALTAPEIAQMYNSGAGYEISFATGNLLLSDG